MTTLLLTGCRIFTGGADLTSSTNKVGLEAEKEDKDSTTFGSGGWKEVKAGLGSAKAEGEGLWSAGDAGQVDDVSWADLGGLTGWSIGPNGAAVGDLAWVLKAHRGSYMLGGKPGDLAPWKAAAASTWPLARGAFLHPPGTARTATGNGTGVQLGAVTSSQYVYAALHVLSVAGTSTPTITVKIQSDADNTFASPADQITFTGATAIGGQILRAAGAITDTWFRAVWTITGSSPSFLLAVSVGIA